jgi:hypothetical protein
VNQNIHRATTTVSFNFSKFSPVILSFTMSTTAGKRGKRKAPANEGKTTKVAVKKPRKPKGMPDFKPGETLIDLVKKQWRLGDLIGWGGFGALYYGEGFVHNIKIYI